MHMLIALALSHRLMTALLTAAVAAWGVFSFLNLPIDAFPDVSGTQVKMVIKAPGMTPEEVETRITALVEQEMQGLPKQTMLRSQSKYAIADITVDFVDGTDIYWARQQVAERLNNIQGDLPEQAQGGLAPMTTPLGEMLMFTVEGPISTQERRRLLDWTIRPQLRNIAGVAEVNSLGGEVRSHVVKPKMDELAMRGLTLQDLYDALQRNNQNDGAGRLVQGEEALLLRSTGRLQNLSDVGNLVVARVQGQAVRVQDVADLAIEGMTRYGAVTQNGEAETVQGLVLGLRGANARQVVQRVEDRLNTIQTQLPEGVTLQIFYNRAKLVDRAIGTVGKALMEAVVLVLIMLVLFLGSVRSALVVALILPLSALATFACMRLFGLSANLMSMGGLAIAVGMLVDSAVVVVENLEAQRARSPAGKGSLLHQVYQSTREVAVPISAGILIIMTVFLPLLTLEGLEGKLFTPVALTIVFALGCSLLLSLTAIPALCSALLQSSADHTPKWVRRMEQAFLGKLTALQTQKRWVFGAALVSLVLAGWALQRTGSAFIPTLDEGDVIMQIEKLPSISLQESTQIDMGIQQRILQQVPEVERIVARVGADELGLDPMGLNETDTFMVLKPADQWRMRSKDELVDAIRQAVKDTPGVNLSFTQPIEMRTSEMLSGVRGDLAIKIMGPDLHTLNSLAQKTVSVLEGIQGSQDVQTTQTDGVEYLQVNFNELALGRSGLDKMAVQQLLRSQFEGLPVGNVQEGIQRSPLLIRSSTTALNNLESLMLPSTQGGPVPLSTVATLQRQTGPVRIDRENGQRMSVVRANVAERDLVGFVEEAKAAFAQHIELPKGYRVTWGGQFENQQRAAARLAWVVPLSMGLIVLILTFTLQNLKQALLVLTNIPLALVGGVFALYLSGQYMSVPATVGFIALMGIAVLNGLVLLTEFNRLLAAGYTLQHAILQGTVHRLRPVLMTAGIAALGLLPLLFATGPGSEIQKPLAIVITGGLVSSTLLTLLLMPLLFQMLGNTQRTPS